MGQSWEERIGYTLPLMARSKKRKYATHKNICVINTYAILHTVYKYVCNVYNIMFLFSTLR